MTEYGVGLMNAGMELVWDKIFKIFVTLLWETNSLGWESLKTEGVKLK